MHLYKVLLSPYIETTTSIPTKQQIAHPDNPTTFHHATPDLSTERTHQRTHRGFLFFALDEPQTDFLGVNPK